MGSVRFVPTAYCMQQGELSSLTNQTRLAHRTVRSTYLVSECAGCAHCWLMDCYPLPAGQAAMCHNSASQHEPETGSVYVIGSESCGPRGLCARRLAAYGAAGHNFPGNGHSDQPDTPTLPEEDMEPLSSRCRCCKVSHPCARSPNINVVHEPKSRRGIIETVRQNQSGRRHLSAFRQSHRKLQDLLSTWLCDLCPFQC